MLISWLSDILPISCATRWVMGAVDVTHGHELLAGARPAAALVWAAAPGAASKAANIAAAATAAIHRTWYLRLLNARRTSAPAISCLQYAPPRWILAELNQFSARE
jgi:hypothetical protein